MAKQIKLLLCCFLGAFMAQAQEQADLGSFLKSNVRDEVRRIERNGGTIVHIESDLIFKDKAKSTFRALLTNREYGIVVLGTPTHISDIDVQVFNSSAPPERTRGTSVVKDQRAASKAEISFVPVKTGFYEMEVKAYQFIGDNDVAHYALIIYNK